MQIDESTDSLWLEYGAAPNTICRCSGIACN